MRILLVVLTVALAAGCAAPRRVFAVPIKLKHDARSRLMMDGQNKRQVEEGRSGQDPDSRLCTGPSPLPVAHEQMRPESK
jgi:hypothetical protein